MRVLCVLGNCEDFKNEIGAMEEIVAERNGHIVLNSPKGHPEIAAAGIEFDWGVSKKIFRKENNHVPINCEKDMKLLLDRITLDIAKHTASKA